MRHLAESPNPLVPKPTDEVLTPHDSDPEYIELTVVTDGTREGTRLIDSMGRVVKGVSMINYTTDWTPMSPTQRCSAFVKLEFRDMAVLKLNTVRAADMPEPMRTVTDAGDDVPTLSLEQLGDTDGE